MFPGYLSNKESACHAGDAGDMGLIPELGRYLGEGNGNQFQCSCLENPRDRGTLQGYSLCGCKRVGRDLAIEQH